MTLCWAPVQSALPVQGYQLEVKDITDPSAGWEQLNEILSAVCTMTVQSLFPGHEYIFRVVAKNAIGYSDPSEHSVPVIIGKGKDGWAVCFFFFLNIFVCTRSLNEALA